MALSLTDLRARLNLMADETITPATADAWIDDTVRDIAGRHNWSWLLDSSNFNTVVGQSEYDLATNLSKLVSVKTSTTKLTPRSKTWLYENHPEYPLYPDVDDITTMYGDPTDYVRFGNKVKLYPLPKDVTAVYYQYKKLPQLSADWSTTPELDDNFAETIVLGAFIRFLVVDEADEYILNNAKGDYEQKIRQMISQDISSESENQPIPWSRG